MPTAWLAADWPAPPRVHGLATLRHGAGVSPPPFDTFNLGLRSGDDPANTARNRAQLVELAGLPSPPHWLHQVHGTRVLRMTTAAAADPDGEAEPEADAAVTSVPGVVLAVLSADCLPVLFAARDGSEVGAAHAGWRGLAAGVLEATVAAMHSAPAQLLAWLGPAAGPTAYEVGNEVRAAFVDADPGAAAAFVATRPGHWRVDLYALARRRLAAVGVDAVHGGGLCTIGDAHRFPSFRRDGVGGRLASVVWIDGS